MGNILSKLSINTEDSIGSVYWVSKIELLKKITTSKVVTILTKTLIQGLLIFIRYAYQLYVKTLKGIFFFSMQALMPERGKGFMWRKTVYALPYIIFHHTHIKLFSRFTAASPTLKRHDYLSSIIAMLCR